MRYLILAQSECTATALGAWLELLGEEAPSKDDPHWIIYDGRPDGEDGTRSFEILESKLNSAAQMVDGSIALNQITVLVDYVNIDSLKVCQEGQSWENLIAMLMLSFPEIRWAFGIIHCESSSGFPVRDHNLPSLLRARRDPLFDPSGLREWVKSQTHLGLIQDGSSETNESKRRMPSRTKKAASIDDEKSYAYFHGYIAWRFGFNADVVTSWALMKELFHDEALQSEDRLREAGGAQHDYDLLIEDMNLSFADKPLAVHLSRLRTEVVAGRNGKGVTGTGRGWHCSKLDTRNRPDGSSHERSTNRLLITTGQNNWASSEDKKSDIAGDNRRTFDDLKNKCKQEGSIYFKPLNGLFAFWDKTKMRERLRSGKQESLSKWLTPRSERLFARLPVNCLQTLGLYGARFDHSLSWRPLTGFAPGFNWPPQEASGVYGGGHSAPGKLLIVAEALLRRAEIFRPSAVTLKDCVKGAVLATEGLELLQGLNPTLSLHALSLKHEYEALAEVSFVGVGSHFEIKQRLEEVQSVTGALCRGYFSEMHSESIYMTALDAEAIIANRLALIYRAAGQFDEENDCMVALRWANRRLQIHKIPDDFTAIWKVAGQWMLLYAEWLISNFQNFILMIGIQVVGYPFVWLLIRPSSDSNSGDVLFPELWKSAQGAINSLFSGAPYGDAHSPSSWGILLFSVFIICSGVFHLGVFISYLYSVLARR